jgi:DNA-binding NtrC family response regulator
MQNHAKILIVDDERVTLRNLEHIMKKEGYDVVSTLSGPNALKFLDEQSFDVVLTDLRMEKVDGMQILRKCRELHPDAEVIMITGFATLESAVEAMKHGAFNYIAKPSNSHPEDLQEAAAQGRSSWNVTSGSSSKAGKVKIISQDPSTCSASWTRHARSRPWTPTS